MTRNVIDLNQFPLVADLEGDSPEDTEMLRKMAHDAATFLRSHKWCPEIRQLRFADGVGGLVAVFIAELAVAINKTDKYLWVIVGDVPSAYLVIDDLPTSASALVEYCRLMEEWILAVRSNSGLERVFPVAVVATEQNAMQLEKRIQFIRKRLLSEIE